ncbi:MAG: iron-sulfur cluster repair di-iron protein [Terriglobia bacterium]|nr:MAG: iron-sulfur cluster repair di-iron protein [Terriglobia bacterium]
MNASSQTTVREIVQEFPQAVRLFESAGIDYCCGGKRTLAEACQRGGIAVETVLDLLQQPTETGEARTDRWTSAELPELVDYIVQTHHAFVRRESPRLTELLTKVQAKHGTNHPELSEIAALFAALTRELSLHMRKEEQALFPLLKDRSGAGSHWVEFPIRQMMAEHEDAGDALAGIRSLSGGFEIPADACLSFAALYQGLEEFERDLHRHIHLENNILFPRALEA